MTKKNRLKSILDSAKPIYTEDPPLKISFEFPLRLFQLHNKRIGRGWYYTTKVRNAIAKELAVQAQWRYRPYKKAKISIIRYSSKAPDYAALHTSYKEFLDVLQPLSRRCPNGFGIIEDDNMECIGAPYVEWVKAPRGQGKVVCLIENNEEA